MMPKPAWEIAKNTARSHQVGRQKHRAKYLDQEDRHEHSIASTNEGSVQSNNGNKAIGTDPWKEWLLQRLCRSAERGERLVLSTLMAGKQHHVEALAWVLDCQPLYKDTCPASMMPRLYLCTLIGKKPVPRLYGQHTHQTAHQAKKPRKAATSKGL